MSKNVYRAENQQGSRLSSHSWQLDPSEAIRRAPVSSLKCYLQGALHDATFSSNKRFRFSQKGTEWLGILKKILTKLGYSSWMYKEGKSREVYVLETLAPFLDFSFDIERDAKDEASKISYIRGFFDAEGGIPQRSGYRFYIQLVQKDKEKVEKIKCTLSTYDIKSGTVHNPSKAVDPNYWRVFILANSWHEFVVRIGSWHPRKASLFRDRVKIWSMPYGDIGVT